MSLPRPLRTLLAAALFSAPAAAQFDQHAAATLYTRTDQGVLQAAIEVEIELGWYLYHSDKGPGVGSPTVVELGGEGLAWSEVRFPEPHRKDQPAIGDEPATYVNVHEGTIVLYAAASMADEESAANAFVNLKGQTCAVGPAGTCVPYEETELRSDGAGKDELWKAFPSDLRPPRLDEREMGDADATLYTRVRDGRVLAALEIALKPRTHIFHDDLGDGGGVAKPTTVTMTADGVEWSPPRFPEPERIDQEGAWVYGHHGSIVVYVEGTVKDGATPGPVSARIEGQTCTSGPTGTCMPYLETAYDRGAGSDELFEAFDASFAAPAAAADGAEERQGLLAFLGLAVFWGLFTLLMPCTYPMIPITLSFFTKQAHARGGDVLPLALVYGAGIVLIFILIGVLVGAAIIPFATHPVTNIVIAGLFVLFAFSLFGWISLEPPAALMNLAGQASRKGGYAGVFLMGACLVITSFTCTAPFVGSLLSVGAADGDLTRIVIGMGVFGLAMAVPFALLALVPGKIASMPRSGQWMNTLKVTLGFVELAAAFKFLSNADLVWGWNIFSRELFLLLWGLIFAAAAVYLFGFAERKIARPGSGRALASAALAFIAGYCFYGMRGHDLDRVMMAIIPNYSGGRYFPEWWASGARHAIVVDDYDRALAQARAESKVLLVNFTGHTCSNCRQMEEDVFPSGAVAPVLEESYVEARLHTDGSVNIERIKELQAELTSSIANPFYVIQDPVRGEVLDRYSGLASSGDFADFLTDALSRRQLAAADGASE